MDKIKIAAVSYLNTAPFLYGIEHSPVKHLVECTTYMPSVCAEKLMNGEADLGLVPVAVLLQMKSYYMITDYCIGATGKVESVVLVSQAGMEQITHVYLDYQSRTSVELAKILLKHYWKQPVQFIAATEGYEKKIEGTVAGVVIGDRALKLKPEFNFVYDLAEAWHHHTGLPFVFACWVSNKKLPEDFIAEFNAACQYGINHIADLVKKLETEKDFYRDTFNYLTKSLSYNLDDAKMSGLRLFLEQLK